MKPHSILLAAILAATPVILSSCRESHAPESEGLMAIDVAKVVTDSVVIHKQYPGYLQALNTINIVGRVDGYLTSQRYNDGASVRAGQVLFTIEPTQYADLVRQAEANLASARSAHEYAASHYAAVKKALQSDAVSQMEVEQARSDMEQAEARIHDSEAALVTARTNLSYCTIKSPVAGRVSESTISVGAYVNGAASPFTLATVYDDSMLDAVFSIEDAAHLKMLKSLADSTSFDYTLVNLTFEETLPHSYTGTVNYVAPEIDTSTGTIKLKARVKNPYGELRDGMYVTIALPCAFDRHAILVKDASIGTDQLGRYLYTVNDSNKVIYTPVKVGELVNDTMRVITEGLTRDSRYVTKALLKVRQGEEIKPVMVK